MKKKRNEMNFENINICKISLGVFVAVCIAAFSATVDLAAGQSTKSSKEPPDAATNVRWLRFSPTEHERERRLVKKYLHIRAADMKLGSIWNEYRGEDVPTERRMKHPSQWKRGEIFIAMEDLNGDGRKEIFAYVNVNYHCGQIGCPLLIAQEKNGKLVSLLPHPYSRDGFPFYIEIDDKGMQKVIGILPGKTHGWHDLSIEGETVWKWDGKGY